MMGIATCNYPQGKPDCNGHSSAFDGVAYLPEEEASRDMCILEADGAEGSGWRNLIWSSCGLTAARRYMEMLTAIRSGMAC